MKDIDKYNLIEKMLKEYYTNEFKNKGFSELEKADIVHKNSQVILGINMTIEDNILDEEEVTTLNKEEQDFLWEVSDVLDYIMFSQKEIYDDYWRNDRNGVTS